MNAPTPNIRAADRLGNVQPSTILGLVQKARTLAARGHPIIDLGIGEPDFTTPEHVKQAAWDAVQRDETRLPSFQERCRCLKMASRSPASSVIITFKTFRQRIA